MTSSHSHIDFTSQDPHAGTADAAAYITQAPKLAEAKYHNAAPMAQQSTGDTRTTTGDYHYQNEYTTDSTEDCSYTSECHSYSASTYDTWSSFKQQYQPRWEGQGYQQYGQYYLPTTSNPPQDVPNYDPEIVIDSIEGMEGSARGDACNPPIPPRAEDGRAHHQQPSLSFRNQQAQENIAYTPTARRWSCEYSPEERMRVGLPRWKTEQHRIDYERPQSQGGGES